MKSVLRTTPATRRAVTPRSYTLDAWGPASRRLNSGWRWRRESFTRRRGGCAIGLAETNSVRPRRVSRSSQPRRLRDVSRDGPSPAIGATWPRSPARPLLGAACPRRRWPAAVGPPHPRPRRWPANGLSRRGMIVPHLVSRRGRLPVIRGGVTPVHSMALRMSDSLTAGNASRAPHPLAANSSGVMRVWYSGSALVTGPRKRPQRQTASLAARRNSDTISSARPPRPRAPIATSCAVETASRRTYDRSVSSSGNPWPHRCVPQPTGEAPVAASIRDSGRPSLAR